MKKITSKFYKTYWVVTGAFVALLLIALCLLWAYLGDYEKSQAKYVAESFFSDVVDSSDISKALKQYGLKMSEFESEDVIEKRLSEITKGKELSYKAVSTGVSNDKKYVITADDKKIAEFTIKESEDKSFFKNKQYEISSLKLSVSGDESISVLVPEGYKVFINDIEVPDEYITDKKVEGDAKDFLPDGVKCPYFIKYEISGLFAEPEIAVFDNKDNPIDFTYDETKSIYSASLPNDETLQKKYSSFVIAAGEAYAKYIQADNSMANVAMYFESGTDLYRSIGSTYLQWVSSHSGDTFSNQSANSFYAYDENTFSCKVSVTQTLTRAGAEDFVDEINLTMYLRKVNGTYKVYDMENN